MSTQWQPPRTSGHLTTLEKLRREEIPRPPIAELLDLRLAEVSLGRAVMEKRHGRVCVPLVCASPRP